MSSWRLLIAVTVIVSLAAVLVVFGRAGFPKAQKTDPSKLAECQKRILQSTVRIQEKIGNNTAVGSGVVVGEALINGKKVTIILTAAHVVSGTALIVEYYDHNGRKLGEIKQDIQVIKTDRATDLAVIAIPHNPNLPIIKIAAESPKVGDRVDIYGCLGQEGTIPCLRGREGYEYFIENEPTIINPETGASYQGIGVNARPVSPTSPPAPVGPTGGMSGGPVTNKNGEIIGICSTQTQEQATGRPANVVNCPSLKTILDFIKNLPLVLAVASPEEEYLKNLKKELEEIIKNASAPPAPELMPMPMP